MSGAPAGMTYLNQTAYEEIAAKYKTCCTVEEAEIEVKHKGLHVAYSVQFKKDEYNPQPPGWHDFKETPTGYEVPVAGTTDKMK